jgi:uncharacterized protein YidB (DUF937 family)
MGLFDSIANAVGGAFQQAGGQQGAQNILNNLLQQGGLGQSGAIVGQLINGLGGGAASPSAPVDPSAAPPAGQSPLAGMLETLAANGLGEQVASWMSNNPNLPITAQQLRDALGSDQVQQLAQQVGLPVGDFLKHLAEHLPQAASDAAGTPSS